VASAAWGVTASGNFEGRTILHVARPLAEVARQLDVPEARARALLEESRGLLLEARAQRPAPLRDDKVLTALNGLMIAAFARGAAVLGDDAYATAASRAARFVLSHLREEGRLLRSYMAGRARYSAYLEDYAFLIAGLLELYQATGEPDWLAEAIALDAVLERHHEDREQGGFFRTSDDHERLLAREKPAYDGAVPTGNSVHALNLLKLHSLTTDDRYRQRAEATLKALGRRLAKAPAALSELLLACDYRLDTPREILIVTPESRAEAEPFLERLRTTFLPSEVVVVAVEGENLEAQARLVPSLRHKRVLNGQATAFVCELGLCKRPTSSPEIFARQLATPTSAPR